MTIVPNMRPGGSRSLLTVVRKQNQSSWLCLCDCLNITLLTEDQLTRARSCGCVSRIGSKTPEASSWRKMMARCYDETNKDYARYHGKGLDVCAFLRESHLNIVATIGRKTEGGTLDRIDNKKGYHCGRCPECLSVQRSVNIRWADRTTQSRNQDRIRLIEIGGAARCVGEWAQVTGIHYQTLMSRYLAGIRGEALIAPPGATGRRYK